MRLLSRELKKPSFALGDDKPEAYPTKNQRGQSAIESTLVLLVFLVTLLGIFDLGQILFIHQTFVERARNAVRFGVVRTYDPVQIQNMVLFNSPTVPSGATSGFLGLKPGMVTVSRENVGTDEERIVVTIAGYPYRFFSPLIAGAFTGRPIVASLPVETL